MQRRSPAFYALIALGVVLLLAGIVYGLGSRQVHYRSVGQGSIAHYLSADGTGYLQMEGNSALYIVHQDNFSPKLPTFADSDTVSFVYDPGETTSVDVKSTLGTHLVGNAAKVVAITASDTASQRTYTTPEYARNAQGYDNNQWPIGIGLLVVGLLLIGSSFFLPRKKQATVAVPPVPPAQTNTPTQVQQQQQLFYQPNTPPYGQPSQPIYPTAYPPTPQNYPPQPRPFQQPSSPNYPQQPPVPFGQSQPQLPPFEQPLPPQQQPQPPNPLSAPQPPQQRPTPQGQFMRPRPFQPPQQ